MIRVLNVKPENITLLANKNDAKKIIRHVLTGFEEKKDNTQYFTDSRNEEEQKRWLHRPLNSVAE
jgi:hypothetical protein